MNEITNELLKILSQQEKDKFISLGLQIGVIHAFRDRNIRTKEIKIKSFLIWAQNSKTGYLSPSKRYIVNANSKLFKLILNKIENSEEFYYQDYYPENIEPFIATMYIPKNLSIKIQNKIKFGYKVVNVKYPDEGNFSFKEFFEISFKNFNENTFRIPVDYSLEFFKYFENYEIKNSLINFEAEAPKITEKFEKIKDSINKEIESNVKRVNSYQNTINKLNTIIDNRKNTEKKIYDYFTEEEISSKKLLTIMKGNF